MFAWAKGMKTADAVITLPSSKALPHLRPAMQWFEAVKAAIDASRSRNPNQGQKISADEAAKLIFSSPNSSTPIIDETDPTIQAKWLKKGDLVSITPTDTGRVPQDGILVGLSDTLMTIMIHPKEGGKDLLAHFPKVGYSLKKQKGSSKL